MQDLYTKSNERLMREIKEDSSKWRNIPCLWIGRLNIVIMSVTYKLPYRFNAILTKIPAGLFVERKKLILKLIWKCKGPRRG